MLLILSDYSLKFFKTPFHQITNGGARTQANLQLRLLGLSMYVHLLLTALKG